MVRTGLLVAAGWVAAAAAAVAVSLSAVSVVHDAVDPLGRAGIRAAESTAASSPAPTPPASSATGTGRPTGSASPTTQTAQTARADGFGGSVVYSCAGSRLTVRSRIPRQGFTVREDDDGETKFESDSHRTEIRVSCPHGSPNATVEEDDRGDDGGGGPGPG